MLCLCVKLTRGLGTDIGGGESNNLELQPTRPELYKVLFCPLQPKQVTLLRLGPRWG